MSNWMKVCSLDEIPRLGARIVRHGDIDIAVFRNAEDEVFAVEDRCPHKGGPLSQGIVHGKRVTCPLHGWNLELDSGCAVAPDEGCARQYEIRLESGVVHLSLA
ncbi:MAG: nitrite reductase small subunit NirD [Thiobacillaceae bacterium]